jgi:hypothetical protein
MRHNLNHQQRSLRSQHGMTFIGAAIVIAAVLFIMIIALKMMPAYIEFMSVNRVLHAMAQEQLSSMSKKEIVQSFNKRKNIDDIQSITADDLVIEKDTVGNTVLSVDYQVMKPVMGNVSVVIDFKASSDSK